MFYEFYYLSNIMNYLMYHSETPQTNTKYGISNLIYSVIFVLFGFLSLTIVLICVFFICRILLGRKPQINKIKIHQVYNPSLKFDMMMVSDCYHLDKLCTLKLLILLYNYTSTILYLNNINIHFNINHNLTLLQR